MSNYRAGDVIRMTRLAIGMSQEELSENICSVQTLHRIENGKTRVKKELYERFMAKMERVPEKNYAVCVGKDMELLEERKLFEDAMGRYDYKKAEKYLKQMKEKADDNLITKQYLLKAEALVNYYCGRIDEEEKIKKLEEAIKVTLPDYEKYIEKEFPFTEQEIMNLMSVAIGYCYLDRQEKAIKLYEKLLQCLDMDYIAGEYVEHMKVIIMRNLSVAYAEIKKYEKALLLNEECMNLAKENNDGVNLAVILSDKAGIILRQIESREIEDLDRCLAERCLRQSYYLSAARKDMKIARIINKFYKKEFEESF